MNDAYEGQARGSGADYARYAAGMDASMRQKVALTAAHLLCEGRVADMGSGSGAASFALARLYPRLAVVGVDVSEEMVSLARDRFQLPNLSFVTGDAAGVVFGRGSLDGILASSMLHHVTTFNGYDHDAARRALSAHVEQLRPHGVLVVRDFVDPGHEEVLLDLPRDDGDDSDDPRRCSTARLFERFAREFRALSQSPGFPLEPVVVDGPRAGAAMARFRTTAKIAAEFVLRKDYRADWESEVKEEYTYFTQDEFERVFSALGLRVLASTPIYNPWIVAHRYEGKFVLRDADGSVRPPPPTNYLIVGERVDAAQGVDFRCSAPCESVGFLQMERYCDVRSGALRDLVRRPNATLDVVPWFEAQGALFVLARTSYPRPILRAEPSHAQPVDGSRASPWVAEPLTFLQRDRPVAQTVEEALQEYAHLGGDDLVAFEPGSLYYPSPGGVAERIESTFVQITPTFLRRDVGARSGFTTSGRVQAIEAEQLLRAAQVGGISDARLELNVYALLVRRSMSWGPWIASELHVPELQTPPVESTIESLVSGPRRRMFRRVETGDASYLSLVCREFEEVNATGDVVARQRLEYVMPSSRAAVTASVAVLQRHHGVVFLGVDDDDFAAVQSFEGSSRLPVAPAWRLLRGPQTVESTKEFVAGRLREEYGVVTAEILPLGGKYHPTPGATPEVVHPFAATVREVLPARRALHWVRLAALLVHADRLHDGHLRIAMWRAAHALGVAAEPRLSGAPTS